MSIILIAACGCVALWLYLLLARGAFWRADEDSSYGMPHTWPEVTVIIPARNEADMLQHTLPTLLAADYPAKLRILLVDDRSEDGTGQVATRIAAQLGASERLTVLQALPLPAGWKGKVWAMQCGLEAVSAMKMSPRYILFTDGDIAYDTGALAELVARAEAGSSVLTSMMVRLRCQSIAERLLIPAFVYFFRMLYPFRWVNEPQHKMAAAAGGTMLVRYDALQRAGGMAAIKSALIDDCALGRVMKKQGAIRLGLTQHIHSLRPYPHISDVRAMVARSAYDQLGYSPLMLLVAVGGLIVTFIAPVVFTLFATGAAQIAGIVSWAGMSLSFFPILRFYKSSPLMSPLLPVIALFYLWFTLDSAWQYARGRGGVWKGRAQAGRPQSA